MKTLAILAAVLLSVLLISGVARAQLAVRELDPPKPAAAKSHELRKKILTFIFVVGLTEGAAIANTKEVIDCRNRAGIEHCETRYGAWKQAQVSDHVLAAVMAIVTFKLKQAEEENGDKHKTWYFIPLATAAGFSYMAANQAGQHATHCEAGLRFNGMSSSGTHCE